jgi:hypothetical protein
MTQQDQTTVVIYQLHQMYHHSVLTPGNLIYTYLFVKISQLWHSPMPVKRELTAQKLKPER